WARARFGLSLPSNAVARGVWIAVLFVLLVILFAGITIVTQNVPLLTGVLSTLTRNPERASMLDRVIRVFIGFALVLPALGGGDALSTQAHELAPPRLRGLRRTSLVVAMFSVVITIFSSFLFVLLVPAAQASIWAATPLSGLAQHLDLPVWALGVMTAFVLAAALLALIPAAHAALEDAEQLLRRLSAQRILPQQLGQADSSGGSPSNSINVAAA